jgi:hypothetical protein
MSILFPSSTGSSVCLWRTVSGKMSNMKLEQQTEIKLCVKIGKSFWGNDSPLNIGLW